MNDLVTFKLTKEAFLIIFNEGIPFNALKQILIKNNSLLNFMMHLTLLYNLFILYQNIIIIAKK